MTDATRRLGATIFSTGALHTALGAYVYRRQIAGMAADGVVNSASDARLGTVEGERRQTAVWFVVGGLALMSVGASIRASGRVAPALGPGLTAIGAVGAVTMPASGFWAVLGEGIAATVLHRRTRE